MKLNRALGVSLGLMFSYSILTKLLHPSKKLLRGKKVLITGGSRGLGFALAERYLEYGARVLICARNSNELKLAQEKLSRLGDVSTYSCDITKPYEVQSLVQNVKSHFGSLDILINNAGIMDVGPLDEFDVESFQRVIEANLVGMIRMTLSCLTFMTRGSQIINITSIGGTVAVPHLLPYCVSKFGALGFSLGLDSELATRKISVTTVVPGLMRTGSFVHALFRGKAQKEFDWFALGATLPLVSISARSAVIQIISAGMRRKRFVVLGPQAKAVRYVYQLFPNTFLGVVRFINRLLPGVPEDGVSHLSIAGSLLRDDLPKGGITRLGDQAGDELNENQVA